MNAGDSRSANSTNNKKPYSPPVITVYGPVSKLTQGAAGSNPDGGNPMGANMGGGMM
jgi:hypothetical protein